MTEQEKNKIQELQLAEQNLQMISLQKQAFQMELNETESSLKETEKAENDIYKIVGQVMLKAEKQDVLKELKEKQEILKLRMKSMEKQEEILEQRAESIKKELEEDFKKKKIKKI